MPLVSRNTKKLKAAAITVLLFNTAILLIRAVLPNSIVDIDNVILYTASTVLGFMLNKYFFRFIDRLNYAKEMNKTLSNAKS